MWALGCLLWLGGGCRRRDAQLDMLPARVLEELTLRSGEMPESYRLITNRALLEQAGIAENPAYVLRRADREVQVKIGAAAGFLALYGSEGEVRLVLQGYYFQKRKDAEKYAEVQESRERRIIAFQRETDNGVWQMFFAKDPDEEYQSDEPIRAKEDGVIQFFFRRGTEG